ncbi:aldehyde dehydrogenase family protein [Novosphingobium cyanobacteriorum]|uniref:aldehyde dehydrogenase (NAD(+)) n=1 Tax=Novosphingobium cyanobacteriorum TaxID=3024215 RepID=A0ABT6CHE5_9SPHN|nr:aldehyde dehydrogenase family protein [Novosphingobium cyanobacteriorum]MDF8333351.1 aldehyde dehydrogenase family protein [Novosphingobium cyanobacteriorum]
MRELLQHYINGQWVDSEGGRRHLVINPATEEPCAAIMLGSQADVDKAVAAAKRAFKTFSKTPVAERKALLERILAEYKRRIPDFAPVISEEMGAPISFAGTAQVGSGMGYIMGSLEALDGFRWEEEIPGAPNARIVYEPIGVVAAITPWNWPLNQICAKVAPCILAGNTVVLKPSEECPSNAKIFAEVLDAAGVPAGVFNLVQGDGPGVGVALTVHPDVDMVSFTGSTRAGIQIAKNAADTVKRVHQELGGKSPNLVLPGADLASQLPGTLQGVVANTGQSCIAPTRLLVPAERKDETAAFVKNYFAAVKVGNPHEEGPHIGPVVNKAQWEKVQGLIEKTIEEGATLLEGGPGLPENVNRGFYIRPTVFADVTPDMTIFREETFGPVATITTYNGLDEGVELANRTSYGLSATVTGDPEEARPIVGDLRAGLVGVNQWGGVKGGSFGGYKQSGNGREGGRHGLKDFMEVKTIVNA